MQIVGDPDRDVERPKLAELRPTLARDEPVEGYVAHVRIGSCVLEVVVYGPKITFFPVLRSRVNGR